jgi:hypothetical protein
MSCSIRCSNGGATMISADVTRHQDLTDEANDLIPLFLGLLNLLDQFAACVVKGGGKVSIHGDTSVADDAVTAAALGLLSLRRTAWRWADHAAGDHQPAQPRVVLAPAPLTPMLR